MIEKARTKEFFFKSLVYTVSVHHAKLWYQQFPPERVTSGGTYKQWVTLEGVADMAALWSSVGTDTTVPVRCSREGDGWYIAMPKRTSSWISQIPAR